MDSLEEDFIIDCPYEPAHIKEDEMKMHFCLENIYRVYFTHTFVTLLIMLHDEKYIQLPFTYIEIEAAKNSIVNGNYYKTKASEIGAIVKAKYITNGKISFKLHHMYKTFKDLLVKEILADNKDVFLFQGYTLYSTTKVRID